MQYTLSTVTPPTVLPVELGEFKEYGRISADDENKLLEECLQAGTRRVEQDLRRAIMQQTLRISLERFPCKEGGLIRLPRAPVQSIASITYLDENGDQQTLDADTYQLNASHEPALLKPAFDSVWPSTRCGDFEPIKINFVAGWASAAAVPANIKLMIKMAGLELYHQRTTGLTGSVTGLPAAYETLRSLESWDNC